MREVRREIDKVRAFALDRKEAIATVKPLLDLAVRHCNTLDEVLEDSIDAAPVMVAGGAR